MSKSDTNAMIIGMAIMLVSGGIFGAVIGYAYGEDAAKPSVEDSAQCTEDCAKWSSQTSATCSERFDGDDCWCFCEIHGPEGDGDVYSVQVW
jgi:hypothetical protein